MLPVDRGLQLGLLRTEVLTASSPRCPMVWSLQGTSS